MLPDGNGFDILAQLRGQPAFATLPIVLRTVKAELGDIRNGLDPRAPRLHHQALQQEPARRSHRPVLKQPGV